MLKILIVEDDLGNTLLLEEIFRLMGHKTSACIDGQSAIEYLIANPDTHLILMDLKLPVLNGVDTTKEIRKFNKDIIIIAQTAYVHPETKTRAFEAGVNAFFKKPLNVPELCDFIKISFDDEVIPIVNL